MTNVKQLRQHALLSYICEHTSSSNLAVETFVTDLIVPLKVSKFYSLKSTLSGVRYSTKIIYEPALQA